MYETFYCLEINIITMLILTWIIIKSRMTTDRQTQNILFFRAAVINYMIVILESFLNFFQRPSLNPSVIVSNHIFSALYYAFSGFGAGQWFFYSTYYVIGAKSDKRWIKIIVYLFAFLLAVLSLSSPFTGAVFEVNQWNMFSKGPLFVVQPVITYGLFSVAAFIAFISLFTKKTMSTKERLVIILGFILFPLVSGIAHLFFPLAKVVWQSLSMSLLLVYTETQFSFISTDSLTGLNNRRSFDSKMRQLASDPNNAKNVHLFMMDVNLFKHINDNFGHPVGDMALIEVAGILKRQLGNSSAFICRFGGDEFVVVDRCALDEAEALRKDIYSCFDRRNEKEDCQFPLSVSIGYARMNGTGEAAVKDVLRRADEMLYKEKEEMHESLHRAKRMLKQAPRNL